MENPRAAVPHPSLRLAACIPLIVSLGFLLPSSARQAVRQDDGKPLQPPLLSRTGPTDLTNFTIASLPGIPFSAVIEAENTDTDTSGTATVRIFHTKVARDSHGRLRVDVNLNLEGTPTDSRLLQTFIDDPVRKRTIILFHAQKLAIPQSTTPPRPSKPSAPPISVEPPELSGMSAPITLVEIHQEELSTEVLDGFTVRHGRQSATYPPSPELDHSTTTVTDYWFSSDLQVFLLVKEVSPNSTVHTLKLQNISRLDPAPELFTIPRSYGVAKPIPPSRWHSYGYCPVP
jgi:hypothetical protein